MLLPLLRVYLNIVIPQVHVTYLEMSPLQSHSCVFKATRTILRRDAELRCDAVRTQDVTRTFAPFSYYQLALMSPKYCFKTVTAGFRVFSGTTAKPLLWFVCGHLTAEAQTILAWHIFAFKVITNYVCCCLLFCVVMFFCQFFLYFTFLQISTFTYTGRTVCICLPVWQTGESPFRSDETCPLWVGLVVSIHFLYGLKCILFKICLVKMCNLVYVFFFFLCRCQMLKIRKSHVDIFPSWGTGTQLTVSALLK